MKTAIALGCFLLLGGAPLGAAPCKQDQDCRPGFVCETTVTGVCDSPNRECVPGCRIGQRGCAGNLLCVDQVCKTCPCPDLCVQPQGCGSRGLPPCPSGQFCSFSIDAGCGATDIGGVCALIPDPKQCPGELRPVCGCDGRIHRNECLANAAGVSVSAAGPCPDPCDNPVDGFDFGFESGGFSGWTFEYAELHGGKVKEKNWKKEPDGHPDPAIVKAATPPMDHQGQPIAPYCGSSMARINDLDGDRHATRMSRKIQLPAALSPCSVLRLRWGALLQDPDHPSNRQPFFNIEIRQGGKTLVERRFNASQAAGGGWKDIREPGDADPVWYFSEEYSLPLHELDGKSIEVLLTVADCADGAHGGAAFIDCFEVVDRCSNSLCRFPGKDALPQPVIPNVFTPNGDGKNERWTIHGVGAACRVRAVIKDRWGVTVATPAVESPTGFASGAVDLWEGVRKNGKPALESENPHYYVLTVESCQGERGFPGFVYVYPCKADPVVSDPQTWKRKAKAKKAARKAWEAKVAAQLGGSWANWSKAKTTSVSCNKANRKWTCTATGKPCPG